MTAATEILITLILTFGLLGASASEVQTTLNDAGFDVSYEDAAYISEYASDPAAIMSNDSFDDSAKIAESIGDKTKESFYEAVDAAFNLSSETGIGGGTVSVPVSTGEYTNGNKFYTDSGGYWDLQIETEPYKSGTEVGFRFVYIDSKGNVHTIQSGNAIDLENYKKDFSINYGIIINGDGTYTLQVVQNWYNTALGESVTDVKYYTYDLPEDMTTVTETDNTTDIPINPDGTITLPDGTVVTPNADGSYTINGSVYYPDKGLTDDQLLEWILGLLGEKEEEKDKPYVPEWEKEEEKAEEKEEEEEIDDEIDDAAEGYTGDMSEFIMNSRITKVFPFCLPFDFVRGVKLFAVQPKALVIEIPFEIPAWGLFPGISKKITIDLNKYDNYFVPMRWVSTIIFVMNLILITPKIVKGANS